MKKQNSTKNDNTKEPLCLFYFQNKDEDQVESSTTTSRPHYISSTKLSKPTKTVKTLHRAKAVDRNSFSSGDTDPSEKPKRAPFRSRWRKEKVKYKRKARRFGKDDTYNLTSLLLSSVKPAEIQLTDKLPPLTEVLSTVQDAWPSQRLQFERNSPTHGTKERLNGNIKQQVTPNISMVPPKLVRRRSVPEEIIRKFSVCKEQTSESEATVTMPEAASSSGKEVDEPTARVAEQEKERPITKRERIRANFFSQKIEEKSQEPDIWDGRSFRIMNEPERSAEEGSSDSDSDAPGLKRFNTIKRAPLRRDSVVVQQSVENVETQESGVLRASQNDFYRNGRGILKQRVSEKYCQTGECSCKVSDTTPSAQEESESVESSETISSPTLCTRHLSSSDNLSSDSEGIPCTCAELTSSKDTSTDPYHSGKSTLSQTVSDKSVSTQDSTVSINSMSTGGSTLSPESETSSPDIDPKTSNKETTTSPDPTPRPPGGKGNNSGGDGNARKWRENQGHRTNGRRYEGGHERSCPRHNKSTSFAGQQYKQCANFKEIDNCGDEKVEKSIQCKQVADGSYSEDHSTQTVRTYEWAERSAEESKLHQHQLITRFLDNNRQLVTPFKGTSLITTGTLGVSTSSGSSYKETENLQELPLMVPRYSALPRSMSMVVNTSSFEASHNSDSESIADSLEDEANSKPSVYFDTKQELKPVRGDINESSKQNNIKWKYKNPQGKAYFVSIDKDGEGDIVTDIYKIPEPPDKIKNNIFKRHASICKNRQNNEKAHEFREPPVPKPTFTKRIRRERKQKQKELLDRKLTKRSNAMEKKASGTNGKRIKSNKKNERQKMELNAKEVDTKHESVNAVICKQDKKIVSKIPVLVKSPGRSLEQDDSNGENDKSSDSSQAINDVPFLPSNTQDLLNNEVDMEELKRHRLSLISSLESTASILKFQQQMTPFSRQWNKNQAGGKRATNAKFQQKFEVIPEERSSSLSSSEDRIPEKDRRRSLPVKLTEATNNPNLLNPNMEGKSFRRYTLGSLSNYIISKLMGRPLQAIPCVQKGPNNENKEIIVFSPKDTPGKNSAKGRDALIAMNREDFDRLSKGWMNFYLLKEEVEEGENFDEDNMKNTNSNKEINTKLEINEGNQNALGSNTIVCSIPSMQKDPTTSGSGTDETCTSPGHCKKQINLDFETFKRKYSLLLKDVETDCFELQECTSDNDHSVKESNEKPDSEKNNIKTSDTLTEENSKNHDVLKETMNKSLTSDQKISKNIAKDNDTVIKECTKENFNENIKNELQSVNTSSTNTMTSSKLKPKALERTSEGSKLSEDVKFNCSNTVLKTTKIISVSPKKNNSKNNANRGFSLPELTSEPKRYGHQSKTRSVVETLPPVSMSSGSDSDSTIYMQAPEVPPLRLDGFCDCLSEDSFSSSSEDEKPKNNLRKPLQRLTNPVRSRNRLAPHDSKRQYKSGKSGWSVTVAGSVAFPDNTPDVQMRLSFPTGGGHPVVSQSDSGFVEERLRATSQRKQEWTVTVKNPRAGRLTRETYKTVLPTLNQPTERAAKKGNKEDVEMEAIMKKIPEIWGKVQNIIADELKQLSYENAEVIKEESPLQINGTSVSFDHKPKHTKMSERDITRNTTSRTELTKRTTRAIDY